MSSIIEKHQQNPVGTMTLTHSTHQIHHYYDDEDENSENLMMKRSSVGGGNGEEEDDVEEDKDNSTLLPTSYNDSIKEDNNLKQQEELTIFSINMLSFPPYMQLIICIGFMFVFYTLSGIAQEYLFVQYDDFDYGFFLTLVQFLFYSAASFIMLRKERKTQSMKPFVVEKTQINLTLSYLLLGTLMMAGVGLGNESMNYLNFPTKMLFKSSKLLVAMAIGFLITGKRYNRLDYTASFSLVLGLFTLYNANNSASVKFEFKGVFLIACALASDSISANLQEKILQQGGQLPLELVFYSHAIGSIYLLFVCLITGQLTGAIIFCLRNPAAILIILAYCTLCFIGVQFVHTMTKLYGILATLTVTSTRKVLSILISYLIFPKPFLLSHLLAIVLVFLGVFLRIYNKNRKEFEDLFAHYILGKKRTRLSSHDTNKSEGIVLS